ncbi:PREDICTED: inactive protein kinase SELMODRAFT_444075-like [Nicotiana attenuata]|uniref:inactive protein kinase SELMODRAFT_444075-like n=1 Tax=Nicotiana attenuata TaxID=49451 RepID=UPI00090571A4|nr:PREDICTED: inactive protein kinase SELMODRAFT_444075-like [Nicotiana attenuata]
MLIPLVEAPGASGEFRVVNRTISCLGDVAEFAGSAVAENSSSRSRKGSRDRVEGFEGEVQLFFAFVKVGSRLHRVVAQKLESPTLNGLYKFTIVEIENAINNIDKTNMRISRKLIGNGSKGELYQGILPSGQVVAIKEMHKTEDAMGSFIKEVEYLSRARHPSIVCLLGFCNEDGKQFLLSSILLSETLEPKLCGFGQAKMLGMHESQVFEDIVENGVYTDPEYKNSGLLTCSTDIYSFGIIMLQVLSGPGIAHFGQDDKNILLTKAKEIGKIPMTEFEDPWLKGKVVNDEALKSIMQIALLCVTETSKERPTIEQVYEELNKAWSLTNIGYPIN